MTSLDKKIYYGVLISFVIGALVFTHFVAESLAQEKIKQEVLFQTDVDSNDLLYYDPPDDEIYLQLNSRMITYITDSGDTVATVRSRQGIVMHSNCDWTQITIFLPDTLIQIIKNSNK